MEKTSIPIEPMSMAQTKFIDRNDRIRANVTNGITTAVNLYLSRIFITWIVRWNLVRPITARGLRLKISKKLCLTFIGMDE